MPAYRYFTDEPLATGHTVIVKDSEFHHLTRVMRMKETEQIELINGQGSLAQGNIACIEKHQAIIQITACHHSAEDTKQIILAQSICRSNRLSFILEKGTELGVTQFWLFPAHHSEKEDCSAQQLHRYRLLLIAAIKQCGRLDLPKIFVKDALEKWKEPIAVDCAAYYGSTEASAPTLFSLLQQKNTDENILFFVGPEKGFSPQEIKCLQTKKVQGVCLHKNILRTDTAGLAALSLIAQCRAQ